MLDFDTCKHCCYEYGLPFSLEIRGWGGEHMNSIEGFYCPVCFVGDNIGRKQDYSYMHYKSPVPDWCPYALEHIMKENADVKQKNM